MYWLKERIFGFGKGNFPRLPQGLTQPSARDLKCSDLDGYASQKMKSFAFTLMHEAT